MKPFPLNAWYAAAYDVEVKRALLARTICERKLVLYRKLDGGVVALEDAAGTACCRCRWGASKATT